VPKKSPVEHDTTNANNTLSDDTGTRRFAGRKNCTTTGTSSPNKSKHPPPLIKNARQKLIHDLLARGSMALRIPISRVRSVTVTSMISDPDPADQQRDERDYDQQDRQRH
jgi:hypothetical protein